jgi:hypothetical protein
VGEATSAGGIVPYLAMPLLRGETLDARLCREGKLPTAEVLRIGREAALGLAAAHARGLVHRDIKPANIWLEAETRRVKVLDFGLARACGAGPEAPTGVPPTSGTRPAAQALTEAGSLMGTPAFMSPEQAAGQPADHRSDLFSLGCVLYLMATGELPFKGADTLATLLAVGELEPTPVRQLNPGLPVPLAELIAQLLAKEPSGRPTSAQAVAEALARMESARPAQRNWAVALAAAAVVLLALAGWYISHLPRQQTDGPGLAEPAPWQPATVDLLTCIDPTRDVVRRKDHLDKEWVAGTWAVKDGALLVLPSRHHNIIEIPYRPPEEYDLRVDFTRLFGTTDVSLVLSKGGRPFQWCASVDGKLFGFNMVDNRPLQTSPLRVTLDQGLPNGERHSVLVQVRSDRLRAVLDGKLLNDLKTDGSNLSMYVGTRLRDDRLLGLSTWQVPAAFHRIEVVEVSGPGKFTRPTGRPGS